MDFPFRRPLTVPARSYAVAVPPDPALLLDCTMGVNPYGYPAAAGEALKNVDLGHLQDYPHSTALYDGIIRFCNEFGLCPQLLSTLKGHPVEKKHLYITATDRELVDILKKADAQKLAIGHDFGVISYNETPMKEILCGGITTLSTDFKQMGQTLAMLVKKKTLQTIANPCTLIRRGSV